MVEMSRRHAAGVVVVWDRSLRTDVAERIGITVSVIVATLLLSGILRMPTYVVPVSALGSPLKLEFSRDIAVVVMLGVAGWVGSRTVLVLHRAYSADVRIYSHCILPALVSMAVGVFWLSQGEASIENRLVIAMATGVVLSTVIYGQYLALDERASWIGAVRTGLGIVSLAVSFYLLAALFGTRARSLVASTAAVGICFLMAVDVLQYEAPSESGVLRVAAVIALVAGQCAWALNLWRARPLHLAFILMIVVYVLVGLARRHFQGSLTWLAVLEHSMVAGLLLILMRLVGI